MTDTSTPDVITRGYDEAIPIADLVFPDWNPRRGDVDAIRASIRETGFFGAALVRVSTNEILVGKHRTQAAQEEGLDTVPVLWVDVDDETALRLSLADNRTADLAYYDDPALLGVLNQLAETQRGLIGTGYNRTAMELLIAQTADAVERSVDDGHGAARDANTPQEQLGSFLAADVRSVILPYSGTAFDDVVKSMILLRKRDGYETNSDLVLALVTASLGSAGCDVMSPGSLA